jgi:heme-degrading monooxygenase HmoA
MDSNQAGQIAVIFANQRTAKDAEGYAAAAVAMEELARRQPGFCNVVSARGADGFGITVSYWADEASAKAWRDHPEHSQIRDTGRDRWYSSYTLDVVSVTRSYQWHKQ